MADSFSTLTDLAKINDTSIRDLEGLSDILNDAPLFAALAAAGSSNGTNHQYTKQTGAPAVGFRAANAGVDMLKATDTVVSMDLKILDASFMVDMAIADAYGGGPEKWLAREGKRFLKAAFAAGEGAVLNGVSGTFDGLLQAMNDISPNPGNIYNAAGAAANAESSIYLIRTNDDGEDVTLIGKGEGGGIKIALGEPVVTARVDASGKTFPAYYVPCQAWMGLQVGGLYSVVRICNIAAATTVNDALIYEALALFPASRQPNLIVMNRPNLKKLRASRTATNATGAPAPRPTEVEGIPIIVTDTLGMTEAVVA